MDTTPGNNKVQMSILAFTLALVATNTFAQVRLPSFDIGLKAGATEMQSRKWSTAAPGEEDIKTYLGLYLQGEINLHIGQRLAVGYFYNRNAFFTNYNERDGFAEPRKGAHLMHGFNLRFSTGRAARIRPFVQIKAFDFQNVVYENGYTLGSHNYGAGLGGGLMIRLNNKIYFVFPEVEFYSIFNDRDDVLYPENFRGLKISLGLLYNFSRRK